jgi:predicted HicB family RNase H-like nuclease
MSILRYKDYQGSVKFEDGRLIIQLLHIDDFVTTECDSAAGAVAAFEELVEDYLATCKELQKPACKPFKGSFNVRVTPSLHRRVAMAASESDETMNTWVAAALEEKIDRQKSNARLLNPDHIMRLMTGSVEQLWDAQIISDRIRPRESAEHLRGLYTIRPILAFGARKSH